MLINTSNYVNEWIIINKPYIRSLLENEIEQYSKLLETDSVFRDDIQAEFDRVIRNTIIKECCSCIGVSSLDVLECIEGKNLINYLWIEVKNDDVTNVS